MGRMSSERAIRETDGGTDRQKDRENTGGENKITWLEQQEKQKLTKLC